jgi:basic amino acid/polyamine antiporter, APA family
VVLVVGIRESARFNNTMVVIKLGVVLLVIVAGAFYVNPANWHPFSPFGWAGLSLFGKTIWGQVGADGAPVGMLAGAAMIFFAYIGFDSVSTHAEEARNPQRDVPFGIITSLLVCTVLYIAVTCVLTGMVPYDQIDKDAPIAMAFERVHMDWAQLIISLGAVAGITSVMLVLMLSQPRVLLAIARDGLLPESFFGAVHPRFRTPWKSTILTGIVVALMASFIPLDILAELVNIGTLLAFVMVCLAVLVMRYIHPQVPRPFRCPWVPVVPVLGVFLCLVLMFSLPWQNWLRLLVWLLIGMVIYLFYGRHHSVMARRRQAEIQAPGPKV